jgi:hypothetical protein
MDRFDRADAIGGVLVRADRQEYVQVEMCYLLTSWVIKGRAEIGVVFVEACKLRMRQACNRILDQN